MGVEIDVAVTAPGWNTLGAGAAMDLTRMAALAALDGALDPQIAARGPTLDVLLSDDAEVRDLNRTWRGQDKPTNVLSFPNGDDLAASSGGPPPHLGDVVLAWETVAAEAEAGGKPVADHLRHLVVHGVLHVLGHDHEDPGEADAMEALETAILARLGVPDPYADA